MPAQATVMRPSERTAFVAASQDGREDLAARLWSACVQRYKAEHSAEEIARRIDSFRDRNGTMQATSAKDRLRCLCGKVWRHPGKESYGLKVPNWSAPRVHVDESGAAFGALPGRVAHSVCPFCFYDWGAITIPVAASQNKQNYDLFLAEWETITGDVIAVERAQLKDATGSAEWSEDSVRTRLGGWMEGK